MSLIGFSETNQESKGFDQLTSRLTSQHLVTQLPSHGKQTGHLSCPNTCFSNLLHSLNSMKVCLHLGKTPIFAVADPGFPRGGCANPRGAGANILIDQFFLKTA